MGRAGFESVALTPCPLWVEADVYHFSMPPSVTGEHFTEVQKFVRSWVTCFGVLAAALVLQLIPITGIFMMMLGGPFWSAVLINLGFALMARDALTGAASKWLLLPPLLWLGGYLAIAAVSHAQANRFISAIVSENSGVRLAFDPSREDLVIYSQNTSEVRGLSPEAFIQSYGLIRAYGVSQNNFNANWSEKKETVYKYQLVFSPCYGTGGSRADAIRDWGDGTEGAEVVAQSLCLHSSEGAPQLPPVSIKAAPERKDTGLAVTASQEIRVERPGGEAAVLKAGWAQPLYWLPVPIIGCGLGDGHWNCFASFKRERILIASKDPTLNAPNDAVGRALGLRKAPIRERNPGLVWESAEALRTNAIRESRMMRKEN